MMRCLESENLSVGYGSAKSVVGAHPPDSTGALSVISLNGPGPKSGIFAGKKPIAHIKGVADSPGIDGVWLVFFRTKETARANVPRLTNTYLFYTDTPKELKEIYEAIRPSPPSRKAAESLVAIAGNVVVIWPAYPRQRPELSVRVLSRCFGRSKAR
jgi:hypothetical protein